MGGRAGCGGGQLSGGSGGCHSFPTPPCSSLSPHVRGGVSLLPPHSFPAPAAPKRKPPCCAPPPQPHWWGGVCVCVCAPPPNTPTPCPAAGSPLAAATLISRPSSHGAALPFVLAADDPFPPFPLSPSLFHPHPPPQPRPPPTLLPAARPGNRRHPAAGPWRGGDDTDTRGTGASSAPCLFSFPPPPRTLD